MEKPQPFRVSERASRGKFFTDSSSGARFVRCWSSGVGWGTGSRFLRQPPPKVGRGARWVRPTPLPFILCSGHGRGKGAVRGPYFVRECKLFYGACLCPYGTVSGPPFGGLCDQASRAHRLRRRIDFGNAERRNTIRPHEDPEVRAAPSVQGHPESPGPARCALARDQEGGGGYGRGGHRGGGSVRSGARAREEEGSGRRLAAPGRTGAGAWRLSTRGRQGSLRPVCPFQSHHFGE